MRYITLFFFVVCALTASCTDDVARAGNSATGIRRIVLVPIDSNGKQMVNYTAQPSDCVIYVKMATKGINIYPDDFRKTSDPYSVGVLRADDGPVLVQQIKWGPTKRYRWALITVRGITGLVHADPPWTAKPAPC